MTQPLTVLVVDDSRVSRMMSRSLVMHLRPGSDVVEGADGEQALAQARDRHLDLAILDMNMPGMNGLELASALHALQPDVRLALLTANVQEAVRQRAEAQGVRFYRKPISEAVIAQILDDAFPQT
ncbi:hypothetical protein GCM10025771_03250 [Niveibacterium umoris]|uniref:CheY-like chemotaxis protein n=1 Tax=Niveibacterium umoris TaxID=1193620 RepID=A0A840BR34_9RHOO|nr:response regulator [Niveibacterium umoris]MBB4014132.1 CheY-like chemotaxis protein [Niveibacterium umoris]